MGPDLELGILARRSKTEVTSGPQQNRTLNLDAPPRLGGDRIDELA